MPALNKPKSESANASLNVVESIEEIKEDDDELSQLGKRNKWFIQY